MRVISQTSALDGMAIPMCLSVPAKVVSVRGSRATVTSRGGAREVDVTHVSAHRGDYVLVQGGIAVAVIDPESAREMLEAWEDVGGSIVA